MTPPREGLGAVLLRLARRHGSDGGASIVRFADVRNADPLAVAEAEHRYQHRDDEDHVERG
ncbi:hypothetical protein QDR37_12765 [Amnibacterium sp. CER49]|uniref:hypothetical protein n=1 Tax=Amnibacterium sp. CER49 TaxID=3039161 RepID=UPI002447065F|nr:hypothetical protein [Amnibacterium sp. CER49]MDH2444820.1 hypothetical protein [Amnibacterium sp. CER49]